MVHVRGDKTIFLSTKQKLDHLHVSFLSHKCRALSIYARDGCRAPPSSARSFPQMATLSAQPGGISESTLPGGHRRSPASCLWRGILVQPKHAGQSHRCHPQSTHWPPRRVGSFLILLAQRWIAHVVHVGGDHERTPAMRAHLTDANRPVRHQGQQALNGTT